MTTLDKLVFINRFANQLDEQFYSRVSPTDVKSPRLVHFNQAAADLIGLDADTANSREFIDIFSGNAIHPAADMIAMLYAGHQFGHYVPQLGDGRAIMMGEIESSCHQWQGWELQLKGAGPTPYSRMGDGRAVLRSTIREYLCSEAMHGLGIATTRALCMIGSDEEVARETLETGAVLTRMAPSHVRFGSFEIFFHRRQYDLLKQLADFVIEQYFPDAQASNEPYVALLQEVTDRTARLIAQWQSVGFAHGVMNTDNMSVLGLTIDYGPFGFLDTYNPGFICNHSDHQGRYAFNQQPAIGLWNLNQFAQALLPLIDTNSLEEGSSTEQTNSLNQAVEKARDVLITYQSIFEKTFNELMSKKFGWANNEPNDELLIKALLSILENDGIDYTRFFRVLSCYSIGQDNTELDGLFNSGENAAQFIRAYESRLEKEVQSEQRRQQSMQAVNPKFILRNYLAQIAIQKAEQGDYTEIDQLMIVLQNPFEEHPEFEHYADAPPAWAQEISVSCSS